jgi:hypothetical protein
MRTQVFGEGEVELKYLRLPGGLQKTCPNGAPSFALYRPRKRPRVHAREKEEMKKEKNQEEGIPRAAQPFSSTGRSC